MGEINRCIFPEPVNNLFLMAGHKQAAAAVWVKWRESSSAGLTGCIFHVGERSFDCALIRTADGSASQERLDGIHRVGFSTLPKRNERSPT